MENQSAIIKIKNLTKKFSNFVALDKLDLTIEENTCVGYLGPNGAGKSTTIKILTGLIRPSSGHAFILGKDVTKNIRSALSDVGVLVEIPQFYSNLTPDETLSYFGKLRGMKKTDLENRISKVLEQVNLSEWRQKKVGTFSKGMKQRLGIACALLHNPAILILDEPTSGLDPRGMIEVRQIIKELKKQGKTIFMSSHLLSEVQEVCDKVAIIDKGKLLRYDSIKNISSEQGISKIKVECAVKTSPEQIEMVQSFDGVKQIEQTELAFTISFSGNNEAKAELLDVIKKSGIRVVSYSTDSSDLESLYMKETSDSVE